MSEYRLWEATVQNWSKVALQCRQEGTQPGLIEEVEANEKRFLPNDLIAVRVDINDCRYLREVIDDLGLTPEFEDVT